MLEINSSIVVMGVRRDDEHFLNLENDFILEKDDELIFLAKSFAEFELLEQSILR